MTDAPTEREEEGAWAKLRRRKVVQWSLAYVAGAWLLLQVIGFAADTIDWPRQIQQFASIGLAAGLPVVLVVAWYHGDRGQQRVSGAELAILSVLLALGGGALWLYGQRYTQVPTASAPPAAPTAAQGSSVASDGERPSIAVLPLVDMTATGGNAYLGDGLSDELSAQLSDIPGMRVAARTSAFEFKGKNIDVRKIGEALGVRYVLEGSVRRDGDNLRVTVQLIDASSGYHVWSEKYDRLWRDVIAVQDDISRNVANALKIVLTPEAAQRLKRGEVTNLKAYDRYLAGISALRHSSDQSQLNIALEMFRQAQQLDPGLPQAYAGLCRAGVEKYYWTSAASDVRDADAACRKALEIDPSLKETEIALGRLYVKSGRSEQAEAIYRGLVARYPQDADVRMGLGRALAAQKKNEEAERSFRTAIDLEPTYSRAHAALGGFLYSTGRAAEATEVYRRVTELVPGSAGAFSNLGSALFMQTRLEEAAEAFEKSIAIEPSFDARSNLGTLYYYLGRFPEAAQLFASAEALAPLNHVVVGNRADALWLVPGRRAESRQVYERAIVLVEEALKVDPVDAGMWAQLAHYSGRAGHPDREKEALLRAELLGPGDMYVHVYIATCEADRGNAAAAAKAMSRAEELGYPRKLLEADPILRPVLSRVPKRSSGGGVSSPSGG
jgi:TolB-like protein/Flp pilus assembly protein TadD